MSTSKEGWCGASFFWSNPANYRHCGVTSYAWHPLKLVLARHVAASKKIHRLPRLCSSNVPINDWPTCRAADKGSSYFIHVSIQPLNALRRIRGKRDDVNLSVKLYLIFVIFVRSIRLRFDKKRKKESLSSRSLKLLLKNVSDPNVSSTGSSIKNLLVNIASPFSNRS